MLNYDKFKIEFQNICEKQVFPNNKLQPLLKREIKHILNQYYQAHFYTHNQ